MPAGVLAQHQTGLRNPNHFGPHDLIGLIVLEHTVLMDTGFVRKGVGPHNGFIGLDGNAGIVTDQFTDPGQLGGVDIGIQVQHLVAGLQRHNHFFKGSVAGSFADAVDGDLCLAGTGTDAGEGIGRGQTQVVMAVD